LPTGIRVESQEAAVAEGGRQSDDSAVPIGAAGDLDVSVTTAGQGTAVVHVSGDVDMLTAPVFAQQVRQQLHSHDGEARSLVIDLTGVTFLGSAGLAVLAEARTSAAEQDVALRVVASSRLVLRPLQVTGLDKLLTIVPDLDTTAADD
jgi:anti-sigma B factor antagonist